MPSTVPLEGISPTTLTLPMRKILILDEAIDMYQFGRHHARVSRVAGLVRVRNPFAGAFGDDLSALVKNDARAGEG